MPAAAVIPAPIAYIKIVAVKKLVVEFRSAFCGILVRRNAAIGPGPPFFSNARPHSLIWVRCRASDRLL